MLWEFQQNIWGLSPNWSFDESFVYQIKFSYWFVYFPQEFYPSRRFRFTVFYLKKETKQWPANWSQSLCLWSASFIYTILRLQSLPPLAIRRRQNGHTSIWDIIVCSAHRRHRMTVDIWCYHHWRNAVRNHCGRSKFDASKVSNNDYCVTIALVNWFVVAKMCTNCK